MGLGLVYTGSHREYLLQHLIPSVSDASMENASLATLAVRFIFVGSENGEITSTILWRRWRGATLGLMQPVR
jgi:26S proteasome regulatory subunit N1